VEKLEGERGRRIEVEGERSSAANYLHSRFQFPLNAYEQLRNPQKPGKKRAGAEGEGLKGAKRGVT